MENFKLLHHYNDILNLIEQVDAPAYAAGRNYLDGAVSHLSPYISRGVISLPLVKEKVLQRYSKQQAHTFIFELAWREYFQRQWHYLGNQIHHDIKQAQTNAAHHQVPDALLHAATGITAIDNAIAGLYNHAYMHNHARMYVASIGCNIGRAHWLQLSRWMYYHLADHDIASNTLSWQWVAGTFSSKKYYCDQANINKYSHTDQKNTFLDVTYQQLEQMPVPEILKAHSLPALVTHLPENNAPKLDNHKPLLLYNAYNLDPLWRHDMDANRVLLLEPSHYAAYPVSDKVLSFIISLSQNIKGLQIFCGEISALLSGYNFPAIYARRHPAFNHYPGIKDEPVWMFPQVNKINTSFMPFWKQCERYI